MSIKFIILDMDNTIYNYDIANEFAVDSIMMYISEQCNLQREELLNMYNISKRQINTKFKGSALSHDKALQIKNLVDNLTIANKIEITNIAKKIYYDTFLENSIPFDGLYDFLILCKKNNIKVAILTNNTLDIQLELCNKLKIVNFVDNIYTSYEIGNEKPTFDTFDYVVEKYKYKKSDILMIGDSKTTDYDGAINYGINALLFDNYKNIIQYVTQCYKLVDVY